MRRNFSNNSSGGRGNMHSEDWDEQYGGPRGPAGQYSDPYLDDQGYPRAAGHRGRGHQQWRAGRQPAAGPHRGYDQHRNHRGFNPAPDQYQDYNNSGNRNWHPNRKESDNLVFLSKTLSSILRHNAERFGLKLMKGGFLYVDDILHKVHKLRGYTHEDIQYVVENNDKKRFTLETEPEGGVKIRANQGHTLEVEELELRPITSAEEFPKVVHGTYYAAWNFIKQTGLCRMKRNHIHFAAGEPGQDAVISGMRSSCEVMIYIDLDKAIKDGMKFFVSSNNVILCPGNDDGYVFPCYFQGAVDRRKGHRLEFDASISSLKQVAADGESSSQSEGRKSKKNKKKRAMEDRDRSGDRQPWVENRDRSGERGARVEDRDRSGERGARARRDEGSSGQHREASCGGGSQLEGSGAGQAAQDKAQLPQTTPIQARPHDKATAEPPQKKECAVWDEAVTVVCDAAQSRCAMDHVLQELALPAVAVCCCGPALGTPDSDITHMLILAQPHIYMYHFQDGHKQIMHDGGLKDLLLSKDVKKVFHTIGSVAASLIHEFDILLNGVPITDIAVLCSKVSLPGLALEELGERFGEGATGPLPKLLAAWPAQNQQLAQQLADTGTAQQAIDTLVTRGKLMMHLHQLCSTRMSVELERKVKKEVYELAVPANDPSLANKIQQLKAAAKAATKAATPTHQAGQAGQPGQLHATHTHQHAPKNKKGKKKNK